MIIVTPTFDRLAVELIDDVTRDPNSRIVIPEGVKDKPTQGRVVAVGPGIVKDDGKIQQVQFAKGQIVVFNRYAGTEIQLPPEDGQPGRRLLIIPEREIQCVLTVRTEPIVFKAPAPTPVMQAVVPNAQKRIGRPPKPSTIELPDPKEHALEKEG